MAAILLFFCLLANYPLLPRLRENTLLNFEFKSEATRANLQENKRILKWRPFWNKVYTLENLVTHRSENFWLSRDCPHIHPSIRLYANTLKTKRVALLP